MKRKHPCHTKLCAFRCFISRPHYQTMRSRTKFVKNDFFLENNVFRGSRFSQGSATTHIFKGICSIPFFLPRICLRMHHRAPRMQTISGPLGYCSDKFRDPILLWFIQGATAHTAATARKHRSEPLPLDQRLYVPSEWRSVTSRDSNPHTADQKHRSLNSVLLTARSRHFCLGVVHRGLFHYRVVRSLRP